MGSPSFVLSIISEGYRLPFSKFPEPCALRNNASALKHTSFVNEAISALLLKNCIKQLDSPPTCVNPLSVSSGKKFRLVIDLRQVNACLVKPTFHYEDLRSLAKVFKENFWFITWDLESGYHHVDIYEPHQTFLGFAWPFNGELSYFVFTVLPFGLSSACYCFTKLLRPLLQRWRFMSFACFLYLDDGISGHPDKPSAIAASLIHQRDLDSAGLKIQEKKSNWEPRQIGEWLGLMINTINMTFQVPRAKTERLKKILNDAVLEGVCSFRDLARFAGFINSLMLAVGPIARLFTRQMYNVINSRPSWDSSLSISGPLLQEFQFWIQNIDAFNGFPMQRQIPTCLSIYTDASDFAYGGFSVSVEPVSGLFAESECKQSSTYRELKAIFYVLSSCASKLRHRSVKIFTDSQSAERIVAVGSSKSHLQSVAVDIFNLCLSNSIQLHTQWIPRAENDRADLLSRFVDKDDWSLNSEVFRDLDCKWGPHTIDRFASHYNSQLPRFNSRFSSPGTEAVDALFQDWSEENNWVCPPVCLISDAIRCLEQFRALGTLIVPQWASAHFWPLLHVSCDQFAPFVTDWVILPKRHDLIFPGPGQLQIYKRRPSVFSGCPSFNLLALRIDFRFVIIYLDRSRSSVLFIYLFRSVMLSLYNSNF